MVLYHFDVDSAVTLMLLVLFCVCKHKSDEAIVFSNQSFHFLNSMPAIIILFPFLNTS